MSLQIIKSIDGKAEYVLLPVAIYKALHHEISLALKKQPTDYEEYVAFDPADYVENSIALARIKAGITQQELAKQMGVTQAYISKAENSDKISAKLLLKVYSALDKLKSHKR
jgi:DNA-binding XRE family transcriptional regulator